MFAHSLKKYKKMSKCVVVYLTNYKEKSPCCEAVRTSDSEEIPSSLCKPEVHYRTDNNPPPVPDLSQINPVHVTNPLLENPLIF